VAYKATSDNGDMTGRDVNGGIKQSRARAIAIINARAGSMAPLRVTRCALPFSAFSRVNASARTRTRGAATNGLRAALAARKLPRVRRAQLRHHCGCS